MPLGWQWFCRAASACMGRHRYLRRDRFRISLSVFFDQFGGLGCQAWDIVPSTPTRDVLSGDFSKGVHELVIAFGCGGDVLHGCIELICVLLPVCLLQVESSPERYGLHGDGCIHLYSYG